MTHTFDPYQAFLELCVVDESFIAVYGQGVWCGLGERELHSSVGNVEILHLRVTCQTRNIALFFKHTHEVPSFLNENNKCHVWTCSNS